MAAAAEVVVAGAGCAPAAPWAGLPEDAFSIVLSLLGPADRAAAAATCRAWRRAHNQSRLLWGTLTISRQSVDEALSVEDVVCWIAARLGAIGTLTLGAAAPQGLAATAAAWIGPSRLRVGGFRVGGRGSLRVGACSHTAAAAAAPATCAAAPGAGACVGF